MCDGDVVDDDDSPLMEKQMSNPLTFPTDVPISQVMGLVAYLRGTPPVDLKTAAYDAWVVIGYAGGVTLGQPPMPLTTHVMLTAPKVEQASALEALAAPNAKFVLPPWLLPLALKILQDILAGLGQ
jgi:hypothetical protein